MKKNCSLEEKLAAIRLVEQGQSARSVSDKLHLGHHIFYVAFQIIGKYLLFINCLLSIT